MNLRAIGIENGKNSSKKHNRASYIPIFGEYFRTLDALHHTEFLCSSSPHTHNQIGTGKYNVETIHILHNAAIGSFAMTEISLHYQEGMLYLAAN